MGYVWMAMDDRRERLRARRREVAQLIRTLRLRAALTQEGLAYRMTQLGEPTLRSQVSMWEMGEKGQMITTPKFLALLQATEPEDRPENAEERQARVLRSRLSDLRLRRPPGQ